MKKTRFTETQIIGILECLKEMEGELWQLKRMYADMTMGKSDLR